MSFNSANMNESESRHALSLRKNWKFPTWPVRYGEDIPSEMPRCRIKFTGIISLCTEMPMVKTNPPLLDVTRDLMLRLSCEIGCDGRPIEYTPSGHAWLYVCDGIPLGCVTTGVDEVGRFILGAWVHPSRRRQGVLSEIYRDIVQTHEIASVCSPSRAMRDWMKKHPELEIC